MSENFKKYFISDNELTTIEQDKLSSKDVAKNINLIIDNAKAPLTIAVTGKSGIGKSSIINLVTEKYEKDTENYNVKRINAWKEEDVSLKANIATGYVQKIESLNIIENNKQNSIQEKIDRAFGDNEKEIKEDIAADKVDARKAMLSKILKCGKVALSFVVCFFITSFIFVIMEYLQGRDIYRANDVFFVENTYLNYRENFGIIVIFAVGLTVIAYIVNTLLKANKRKTKNTQVATEQSNNESVSNDMRSSSNIDENNYVVITNPIIDENRKNIIIIEDIDKLSAGKMLKTLEELKYCNDYKNCIFIVPFDEKVVKKAIDVRNEVKLSANYKPLKFEKILDKLFKYKVNVPHIANVNIKDYSVSLVKESIPNFIAEYTEADTFERVIKNVLIYKYVTTPRHAKKLINSFINNKILIKNRAEMGTVDDGYVNSKRFDFELAKITVLQSDFPELYNLLFREPDYLEILTQLYCMEIEELRNVYQNLDEELRQFISAKYRPLRDFLKQTKSIKIENISTLMYLTKVKTEIMYKDKSVVSYIEGNENITELKIQEILELVKLIDEKDDLRDFTANNFEKLLEEYKNNSNNKIYFMTFNNVVNEIYDYIDEQSYTKYLEMVADNYNYYPQEAFEMFKNVKTVIPDSVMTILFERMSETISKENFDETFEFIKENSDFFYEENGNVSAYVQFLVNNIKLSSKPTEVIEELDENFNRIGKVYELNNNIKDLENLEYDKAYAFMAKCVDNGDIDKMVNVLNAILSDENSVESYLHIEEKMNNYSTIDLIECNVDDIIDNKFEGDKILLKNLIEVASNRQDVLDPTDVMKLIEKALSNVDDEKYLLDVYSVLNKFDRMYFYEIRRDFNEIIYASFHVAKNKDLKKAALDCTRFFKNTHLFKTKLDKSEEKFYSEN